MLVQYTAGYCGYFYECVSFDTIPEAHMILHIPTKSITAWIHSQSALIKTVLELRHMAKCPATEKPPASTTSRDVGLTVMEVIYKTSML